MFFADDPDLETHQQHDQARLVCYTCPVQIECLKYCLDEDQRFGVWGGLTESQRKRYLVPAIRRHGSSREVLEQVVVACGVRILRRLEPVPA
jgi:hypothetical protein